MNMKNRKELSQMKFPFSSSPSPFAPYTHTPMAPFGKTGGFLSSLFSPQAPVPFQPQSSWNLVSLLQNTQKALKVAQTVGPIIQQYGPVIKQLPQIIKLLQTLQTNSTSGKEKNDTVSAEEEKNNPPNPKGTNSSIPKLSLPMTTSVQTVPNLEQKKPSTPKLYI